MALIDTTTPTDTVPAGAGAPGPLLRSAARGLRALQPPSTLRVGVALALLSFLAALVAARVQGPDGPWLYNLDLPKIHYPLASFFHDALAEGRLPLWNDHLGLGFPLYAEGQVGAFYPPNWLIFQLPPLVALDVHRVIHLVIAGVGAGLLALRWTGSRSGAFVAALVAVLGGAITAKLEWHNLVAAYAFLPWILLPLVRRPGPTPRGLVAAGILFGIQAWAGHPNTWLLTGLAAALVLLATTPRLSTLPRVVGFGLLGLAVGAVQLVPTALLTTLSVRSRALSANDLFTSSTTPFDILGLGFQNAFAREVDGAWGLFTIWYPDGVFALLEAAVYVGLPVLALAAIGVRAPRARPLLVVAAVCIAIPVIAAFRPAPWMEIPFLNGLRSPVRSYVILSVVIGLLAAFGVGRLGRSPGGLRRAAVAVGLPVAAYGLVVLLATQVPAIFDRLLLDASTFMSEADSPDRRMRAIAALTQPWPLTLELTLAAAALAVIRTATRRPNLRPAIAPLALLVAAVPLLVLGPAPNPLRPSSDFSFAGTDFVRSVGAAQPYRVLTLEPPGWYDGMPDQLAAARIPDLRMFSSLDLLASDELLRRLSREDPDGSIRRAVGVDVPITFRTPCTGTLLAEVINLQASICRDEAALRPPYWIPTSAVTVGAPSGSPIRPRTADLAIPVVTERAIPQRVERRDTGSMVVAVDAPADGWVWIDRAWWPGWRLTLDGRDVEPLQALAGQLVPVPAGTRRLEQVLVPWDALLGMSIGLAGLLVALGWLWRQGRRPSPSSSPSSSSAPAPAAGPSPAAGPARPGPADAAGIVLPAALARLLTERAELLLGVAAVSTVALLLFLSRLLEGVGFWDTGVFQTTPAILGLPHPTGYPTFNLLGWAWSLLPIGDVATRLNAMTAVAGALGVGAVFLLARSIGAGTIPAAAGALTLAFTVPVWRTAVRADPHPLHLLVAVAILLLLVEWRRRDDHRLLMAAALAFGIGLGNHMLLTMLAPGIGLYVLASQPMLLRQGRRLVYLVRLLVVGAAVYLYVPLRAAAEPPLGMSYAPTTWDTFWRYVLGGDFSEGMGFLTLQGPGRALAKVPDFVGSMVEGASGPIVIGVGLLAAAGLATLLLRDWRKALLLVLAGGVTLYAALTYPNADIERYYIVPAAILVVLAALGAAALLDDLERLVPATKGAAVLLLIAPLVLASTNGDRIRTASASCYVDATLAAAAPNAVLMTWWSYSTPLWYATRVEGRRPDLEVFNGLSEVPPEVDRRIGTGRPIYLVQPDSIRNRIAERYDLAPVDACGVTLWQVTGRRSATP